MYCTKIELDEAIKLWEDSPIFQEKRKAKGPFDFGDQKTVGLYVKKIGTKIASDGDNFGMYLGEHDSSYVVLVFREHSYSPTYAEAFSTIGEMKSVWQLD